MATNPEKGYSSNLDTMSSTPIALSLHAKPKPPETVALNPQSPRALNPLTLDHPKPERD